MLSDSVLLLLAKATVVLVAALGLSRALHRASAGARHLVWLAALGALLLVPALAAWGPLRFAVLPASPAAAAAPLAALAGRTRAPDGLPAAATAPPDVERFAAPDAPSRAIAAPEARPADWTGTATRLARRLLGAVPAALALWAAVALAIGASLVRAWLAVRRIVRRARPLDGRAWLDPLWEIADRLALDEPPRLLRSEDAKMPFACGIGRPTVVLPAESDGWSADRRRAVLLHELAHVRRRDLAGHTLARVVCAVYWFHPLVWTAARRLRAESERACDDIALACGARAADYAEHLLDIVTSVRRDATPLVALAMARRNEFEGRMLDILDPERPRAAANRRQAAALVGALALLTVVVGAAAPAPAPRATPATPVSPVMPMTTAQVTTGAARSALALSGAPSGAPSAVPGAHVAQTPREGTRSGIGDRARPEASPNGQPRRARDAESRVPVGATVPAAFAAPRPDPAPAPGGTSTGTPPSGTVSPAPTVAAIVELSRSATGRADERVDLLAKILRTDSSASLRRVAAWGLAQHADLSVAVDALAAALRSDASASVREMAAWALSSGGRSVQARDALAAALRADADPRVRETAAWTLGTLGARSAADALTAALGDASAEVRTTAAWALGSAGVEHAPAPLVALLRDRDPGVRRLAAWALYTIQDPSAIPALKAAMRAETDRRLQTTYVRALAALGERSIDALTELLDSSDPETRAAAVRALAGGGGAAPWPWPWPRPRPSP